MSKMKILTNKIKALLLRPRILAAGIVILCLLVASAYTAHAQDLKTFKANALSSEIKTRDMALNARLHQSLIPADVLSIYDGDSVKVRAHIWLGQELVITVPMAGIDTPELKARCQAEREKALAARDFLKKNLKNQSVFLTEIKADKYSNRIVAKIIDQSGRDINQMMIDKNHARAYHGQKRQSWCS
jgi:endonuclease YncB( thermonuclease family)